MIPRITIHNQSLCLSTQDVLFLRNCRRLSTLEQHPKRHHPSPSSSSRFASTHSHSVQLPKTSYTVKSSESSPLRPKSRLVLFRRYIYILCFGIGLALGNIPNMLLVPVPPDKWGGEHDAKFLARFQKAGRNLPIVQQLDKDVDWEDLGDLGGWSSEGEQKDLGDGRGQGNMGGINSFLTKTLGGVHTLGGFQRVYRNTETGELIAVVHIGCAAWGWPLVTHGGLLATIMDECMAICSFSDDKSEGIRKVRGMTQDLSVRYLQKVRWSPFKENFWLVRVRRTGVADLIGGKKRDRRRCAEASLETLDGVVCVEAEGCYA